MGRGGDQVKRFLRFPSVGAAIKDELAVVRGKNAKLQTTVPAIKKSVVLDNLDRSLVRKSGSLRKEFIDTLYSGLYFDTSRQVFALSSPVKTGIMLHDAFHCPPAYGARQFVTFETRLFVIDESDELRQGFGI